MTTTTIALSILLQTGTEDPGRFNEFLLLAYAAMWLVVIVYLVNLASKQRNLHQEIKLMRRLLEEDEGNDNT